MNAVSGGCPRPGLVRAILGEFRGFPHRGSGTYFESRAARRLRELSEGLLAGTVEYQGFAVDLSSGAWNVAVHGFALLASLLVFVGGGLAAAATWGAGPFPVDLGLLGELPLPAALAALASALACLASRAAAGRRGWSLASFLVPNADSANVIATTVPALALDKEPRDRRVAWRWRFGAVPGAHPAEADAEEREAPAADPPRLLVMAAHYDSARCLRAGDEKPSRITRTLLKGGLGLLPTAALLLILAFLLLPLLALAYGRLVAPLVLPPPWPGILGILGLVLFAASLVATFFEFNIARQSSNLPFNPGFNDNLSGVAAVLAASTTCFGKGGSLGEFALTASSAEPPDGMARAPGQTHFMALFTGSEENGLRGSMEFARDVLEPALEAFGPERVFIVNVDTVSGGDLVAAAAEHIFVGLRRWGDPDFLKAADPALAKAPLPIEARSPKTFKLSACTDLTGFLSRPGRGRGALRAFTLVSEAPGEEPRQPRDYHSPLDTLDRLLDGGHADRLATVERVAEALADLGSLAVAGKLDG